MFIIIIKIIITSHLSVQQIRTIKKIKIFRIKNKNGVSLDTADP